MKVGDKVKLVWVKENYKFLSDITIGKFYEVTIVDSDGIEIIDDVGDKHFLYDYEARFEPVTNQQPEPIDKGEKYQREIAPGIFVDIYDVLEAWGVSCPARQHAIKKLLAAGQRGHKSEVKDLQEANHSAHQAIMFQIERERKGNGQ